MPGLYVDAEDALAASQLAVVTGSSVRLLEPDGLREWEVLVVSSADADPDADRISDQCPLGEALLGRRAGDQILVEAPQGTMRFRVLSVSRNTAATPDTFTRDTTGRGSVATMLDRPRGSGAAFWQGGNDHDYQ